MLVDYLLSIDPGDSSGLAFFEFGVLTKALTLDFQSAFWEVQSARNKGFWILCEKAHIRGHQKIAIDKIEKLKHKVRLINPDYTLSPVQWKGGLPKNVTKSRVLRLLSKKEIKAIKAGSTLDAFDAIGLGLVFFERCSRGLV